MSLLIRTVMLCAVLVVIHGCSKPNEPDTAGGDGPTTTSTGNAFTGRMVDADGLPVAGAAVSLYPVDFQPQAGGGATADTVTDSLGCFRLTKPAGNTYNVFGGKGGDGVLVDSFVISDDTVSQNIADCVMLPCGSISGISHMKEQVDTNQTKIILFLTGTGRMATVGMDGAFSFPQVPAGTYQFVAVPYYDYYSAKILDVVVVPGQETVLDTLFFEVVSQDTVTAGDNSAPVPVYTISQDTGSITTLFSFDASGSYDAEDAAIDLLVRWDWNDDGWDTGWNALKTAVHRYATTGVKTVKLEVLDPHGLTAVITRTLTVENTLPVAVFTVASDTVREGDTISFNAAGVTDLENAVEDLEIRWDWESDGVWDTGWETVKTAVHAYDSGGSILVTLQVRDTEGGVGAYAASVYVIGNGSPVPAFSARPGTVSVGRTCIFDASGSTDPEDAVAVLEVRWDWESDGEWDSGWLIEKTARHIFTAAGTYGVRLEVRDTRGKTSAFVGNIDVCEPVPTLIGHWQFDGAGTIATDLSDGGNDGVLVNGTGRVSGFSGNALRFDGLNDYVDFSTADVFQTVRSMTVAVWVKTSHAGTNQIYVTKSEAGDFSYALYKSSDQTLKFCVSADSTSWSATRVSTAVINDGRWHHLVGVYSGSDGMLDVYIDGIKDNGTVAGTVPAFIRESSYPLRLGIWEVSATYYADAEMDEFMLYNYALSATEVRALYDRFAADALATQLVAYWDFNEGAGTVLSDNSEYGNAATLVDNGISARWGDGISGTGLDLAGDSARWVVPTSVSMDLDQTVSVSAWVRPDTFGGDPWSGIFRRGNYNYDFQVVMLTNGNVRFDIRTDGGDFYCTSPQPLELDEWNYVVGVYDGRYQVIYVNGEEQIRMDVGSHGLTNYNQASCIGHGDSRFYKRYFYGGLDELKIYRCALRADDVAAEWEALEVSR